MKVLTYHIADNIDVKSIKKLNLGKIISETNSEVFIELSDGGGYMSAYEYGSVAFAATVKSKEIIEKIKDCCYGLHTITDDLTEDILVEFDEESIIYDDDKDTLYLPTRMDNNKKAIRIIMFDLSQTVALEYYGGVGDKLLVDIKKLSKELEEKGELKISKKEIMKFIGRSLNVKNNIVDTLYIFDSPDMTWSDSDVSEIHNFLYNIFDIRSRFKEIENLTSAIGDNLDVYKEIYHHKHSSTLEMVVIVLIIIEILQSFASHFLEGKNYK